jgi:uncharacterized membrane protein YGL010W
MKSITEHLTRYATYHRDARNIATHFVGIPIIVLSVAALLARPAVSLGPLLVSPTLLLTLAACLFYLALDRPLGLIMTGLMAASAWFGVWAASLATPLWLALGVGGFVVGWIIQFVGHYYEGRKPAFLDDIAGLAIGPLFVVAEALFMLGAFPALRTRVEAGAGPVRWQHSHAALP